MSGLAQVPPFDVLAAALRTTTERLATEIAAPSAAPPDWNSCDWTIAQSVAAMHGISVVLANRIRWAGPPEWQAFLAEQRRQSMLRDERIDTLLQQIDAALRTAGVGCIALKGGALRALGVHRPGERPMGDIDLLARETDLPTVDRALRSLGYGCAFCHERHTVYEPPDIRVARGIGEHVDNPLRIEVHAHVAEALPFRKINVTNRLLRADLRAGVNEYPSIAALLLHLLLHAAGNMRAHALRFVQLHDIAMLAGRLGASEWETLLEPSGTGSEHWWAFPPLVLTERYYPGTIPEAVLDRLRRYCPRALRSAAEAYTVTDVSWSNLRIYAFPGIVWARTWMEALFFAKSRVLPSRAALQKLRDTATAQPQLDAVPWYGLSQGTRIARWVFSRPPRVQTLTCVLAAFERTTA